jgi:hypothetical protein
VRGRELDATLGDQLHAASQGGIPFKGLSKDGFVAMIAIDIGMVK